jgi:hypothetical protein
MAWTRVDGWVWVFACIDHYTAEAWAQVAKIGDRFAALQPVYDAVIDRWGRLGADVARGLWLPHDWGPQYRSGHFPGSLAWLGIADDAAFLGEPETNGCAERWIRTLKEQCLWAELYDSVDQFRQAVTGFVESYNTQWLIGRHGHRTPRRPTKPPARPRQRDQIDLAAVQPSGCYSVLCSPVSTPLPMLGHEDQLQVEGSDDCLPRRSSSCRIDHTYLAACWSGTATASIRRPASGRRWRARSGAPGWSTTTPSPNGSGRLRPARS